MLMATLLRSISENTHSRGLHFNLIISKTPFSLERLQTEPYYILMTD